MGSFDGHALTACGFLFPVVGAKIRPVKNSGSIPTPSLTPFLPNTTWFLAGNFTNHQEIYLSAVPGVCLKCEETTTELWGPP